MMDHHDITKGIFENLSCERLGISHWILCALIGPRTEEPPLQHMARSSRL
jgi:hypothetical protein